ncbi:MAG: hypothetical protein OCC45_12015 [Desulfotalea sp.]
MKIQFYKPPSFIFNFFDSFFFSVKTQILKILVFILFYPVAVFAYISPTQDLSIVSPQLPEWRYDWQQARNFVLKGDLNSADNLYFKILKEKPYLIEVRWEYANLKFLQKDFLTAKKEASLLLEINPSGARYNLLAGDINFAINDYEGSLLYYSSVYDETPFTEDGTKALDGIVQSNLALGNEIAVLPLLRQLVARKKSDLELTLTYLDKIVELGRDDEASNLISDLIEQRKLPAEKALNLSTIYSTKTPLYPILLKYYLLIHSDSSSVKIKLVNYYLKLGSLEKAEKYLSGIPYLAGNEFKRKIALEYNHRGVRPDKALTYYEEIQVNKHGDKDINNAISELHLDFAINFLILAENLKVEQLWNDLSRLSKYPEKIVLLMVELLIDKKEQVHAKRLIDFVTPYIKIEEYFRLALAYRELGETKISYDYLQKIDPAAKTEGYFQLKYLLEEELSFEYESLLSELKYIELSGLSSNKISSIVSKAESLGCLSILDTVLNKAVREKLLNSYLLEKLVIGYAQEGRRGKVLFYLKKWEKLSGDIEARRSSIKAKAYQLMEEKYLAEKTYRLMLVNRQNVIEAAIGLAQYEIKRGLKDEARELFEFASHSKKRGSKDLEFELYELEAELLVAEGEYDDAEELLVKLLSDKIRSKKVRLRVKVLLLKTLQHQGDAVAYDRLLKAHGNELKIYINDGELTSDQSLKGKLVRADNFYQNGNFIKSSVLYEQLHKVIPNSVLIKRRLYESYAHLSSFDRSVLILKDLVKLYPQETLFTDKLGFYLGRNGQTQEETIVLRAELGKLTPQQAGENISTTIDLQRLKRQLYLARSLWRADGKKASIELYFNIVETLEPAIQELEILPNPDSSYWENMADFLYFTNSDNDKKMSIHYLLENIEDENAALLANLYPVYKWHSLINKEYEARNATYEQRLMLAERKYRQLFLEDEESEAIADLAPIYKRLRNFNEEARVYKYIQDNGRYSNELSKSIKENDKQRSARLQNTFHYTNREGRNGAIDMQLSQYAISYEFPSLDNKDFYLEYSLNHYATQSKHSIGHYMGGGMSINFQPATKLSTLFGMEYLDKDDNFDPHGLIRLDHRLFDRLNTYVQYSHERVDDTIEAVDRQIFVDNLGVGALFESEIGIDLGIEYNYGYLTDKNEQALLKTWLVYNIFIDNIRVDFRYDGTYFSGEGDGILPYWNPVDYREHKFSAYFQHQIEGIGVSEEKNSYYAFELGVGFEDDQNIIYTGKFDILLEMNTEFLLKGSLLYSTSDEYEESSVLLDVIYRW